MAIRGITFSKQVVSSNDDAHIYGILLDGRNGRTKGCKMTFGTDDIYISEGYFFVANRLVAINDSETIASPIVGTTTFCRLVFEVNLSQTNTTSLFNQGAFKILTDAADYPAPRQEDLENGGEVFQLPFARFIKTVSGISNFVAELETIGSAKESTTIYVDYRGSDETADGTTTNPYKTIQAAVNSIPKDLAGHTITISVGFGSYAERVKVANFHGGKLVIGNRGDVFIIEGIEIDNSAFVETNIYQIDKNIESSLPLFVAKNGSRVLIDSDMLIDGINQGSVGIMAENAAHIVANNNVKVTANNNGGIASATKDSTISFDTIAGSSNMVGVQASRGSIVSYRTNNASTSWGNNADSGGLVLTGSNSTTLSGATLDL